MERIWRRFQPGHGGLAVAGQWNTNHKSALVRSVIGIVFLMALPLSTLLQMAWLSFDRTLIICWLNIFDYTNWLLYRDLLFLVKTQMMQSKSSSSGDGWRGPVLAGKKCDLSQKAEMESSQLQMDQNLKEKCVSLAFPRSGYPPQILSHQ